MAKVERHGSIVTIKATVPGRIEQQKDGTVRQQYKDQVIHMVCVARPGLPVGGSEDGYRCVALIDLDRPALNGGKTVAIVESHPSGGNGVVRHRHAVLESAGEILAAFKEAAEKHCLPEDQVPKVGEQTLGWRIRRTIERMGRPFSARGESMPNFHNH